MEDLREITIKVDNSYLTILNTKKMFDTLKDELNFTNVLEYQKERTTLVQELKINLKSKDFEKCNEIKNRIILLETYISMFFLIDSIKEISCENN